MKDREYKRVMAFVKDGIRSGEFQVGSKLPTEREMAETLGILGSGNRFMITIMQVFSEIYKESIRKGWENADAEKFEKMWKLHVEIAEAIETGDQKKIDAAIQAHYDIIHK